MDAIRPRDLFRLASFVLPSRPALRVCAYLAAVCSVLVLLMARSALGAAGEATLSLGRRLEGLDAVLGATKTVEVNGQPIFVSTGFVSLPLREVLDRVERECREHPSALGQMAESATVRGQPLPFGARVGLGILRQEDAQDGAILCLVRREEGVSLPEALRVFAETMDIGALGDPVVLYANATSPEMTHVRTIWTRGSFKVLEMVPHDGDAPGSDSSIAARPRHARRILTGVTPNAPYGVRVYTTDDPPDALLASFDADMGARGWKPLETKGVPPEARAYFHPSGVQALAQAARRPDGTIFSLVELGVDATVVGKANSGTAEFP
jgi:hypothetical protein